MRETPSARAGGINALLCEKFVPDDLRFVVRDFLFVHPSPRPKLIESIHCIPAFSP